MNIFRFFAQLSAISTLLHKEVSGYNQGQTSQLENGFCTVNGSFNFFFPEDQTYLPWNSRSPQEYAKSLQLDISLEDFIINKAKETGRKIKILDAGCGQASAIDHLLSNNTLKHYIESISGISLHYFENVKKVREKHDQRFHYYYGTVQDVLSKEFKTPAFDLIFDVWGAYIYSEDKLSLIQQYHNTLEPGGQVLLTSNIDSLLIDDEEDNRVVFFEWATKKYPETFTSKFDYYSILTLAIYMKKTTGPLLLPEYEIESSKKVSAIDNGLHPKHMDELIKGNAVRITEFVRIQAMGHQASNMRNTSP